MYKKLIVGFVEIDTGDQYMMLWESANSMTTDAWTLYFSCKSAWNYFYTCTAKTYDNLGVRNTFATSVVLRHRWPHVHPPTLVSFTRAEDATVTCCTEGWTFLQAKVRTIPLCLFLESRLSRLCDTLHVICNTRALSTAEPLNYLRHLLTTTHCFMPCMLVQWLISCYDFKFAERGGMYHTVLIFSHRWVWLPKPQPQGLVTFLIIPWHNPCVPVSINLNVIAFF
jgi:hypothetical protein